jgi:hypothetical protein
LVVVDSLPSLFLAAGLSDRVPEHVYDIMRRVLVPLATDSGLAVVLTDKPGARGRGQRGAAVKVEPETVTWRLEQTIEFDAERPGCLRVECVRDRRGLLIRQVRHVGVRSEGRLALDFDLAEPAVVLEDLVRRAVGQYPAELTKQDLAESDAFLHGPRALRRAAVETLERNGVIATVEAKRIEANAERRRDVYVVVEQ